MTDGPGNQQLHTIKPTVFQSNTSDNYVADAATTELILHWIVLMDSLKHKRLDYVIVMNFKANSNIHRPRRP